ncbi:MAG: ABC transporter ATP-binding protein [Betaproteobacteria bacterium]
MITLTQLTKHYPGAAQPAVDHLTLTVPEGEVCVLIGPSGCGKTTTMRLINRMIEPGSGKIELMGRDVTHMDAVELRRGIGYVIQQVGLFPHLTIAENIATVPRLLGWKESQVAARIDELLDLVALPPATYRERFPRDLSGGQKQRVGVARALAADPPVMLMDEPFGAIDPITRTRLQDEFLRIQERLKKTVVFVTHDLDEAIKMGDRIVILRDGKIVQYDRPERILAHPANTFVEEFVGQDRALKRLSLYSVGSRMRAVDGVASDTPRLNIDDTLRDALSLLLSVKSDSALVLDASGAAVGTLRLEDIHAAAVA